MKIWQLVSPKNLQRSTSTELKISENTAKITNPNFKSLYRFYSRETGKAEADLITVYDEVINENEPYELFDPDYTWKRKTIENYELKKLLVPIFENGELTSACPTLNEIREHCKKELASMWDEVLRFENPHNYYVDLSKRLWDEKHALLSSKGRSSK